MKTFSKITLGIILLGVWLVPMVSSAAKIFFDGQKNIFAANEEFLLQVFLDAQGAIVNALEGEITVPSELLELKEIRDGNSMVNFWIEKPHSINPQSIAFSGITIGGLTGSNNFLFSLIFRTKKIGSDSLKFENGLALQNDGIGTKVPLKSEAFVFSVSNKVKASGSEYLIINDTEPPNSFQPFIGNDPTLFTGKYFLVFTAQDKGGGIDHYEVREGFWDRYQKADSPYLLEDQSLKKRIYIKAIDKSGNERIVILAPLKPAWWYQYLIIIGIIFLIIISLLKKYGKSL
ncbi:MAG TPA: hypothetical protein VJC04_01150 [Candidatus Paceibacterota bacterium]